MPSRKDCTQTFRNEFVKIEIDSSPPSTQVIRVLDELVELRSAPKRMRLDNGPEFISAALQKCAQQDSVTLVHTDPECIYRTLQPHLPNQAGSIRVHLAG